MWMHDRGFPQMGVQGLPIYVVLNREERWFDSAIGEARQFRIGSSATFAWPDPGAGTYYVEIFHLHGVLVSGSLSVQLR